MGWNLRYSWVLGLRLCTNSKATRAPLWKEKNHLEYKKCTNTNTFTKHSHSFDALVSWLQNLLLKFLLLFILPIQDVHIYNWMERPRWSSPYIQQGINSQSSDHEFLWVLMKLGSPTSVFAFGFKLAKIAHENS